MRSGIHDGAWVAVQTRANAEKQVALSLVYRGYESFLPLHLYARSRFGKKVTVELPLFQGYVFCKWSSVNPFLIVAIPGVIRVLGNSQGPAAIDETEMRSIRRVVDAGSLAKPWQYLSVGQRVIVHRGPLHGVEGIIADDDRSRVLVLSVSLMQRSIAVQISREDVSLCPISMTTPHILKEIA